jgi:hypothetical protein
MRDRSTKCLVRNLHNDPLAVGLFIPFKSAWLAVKDFIETDGEVDRYNSRHKK